MKASYLPNSGKVSSILCFVFFLLLASFDAGAAKRTRPSPVRCGAINSGPVAGALSQAARLSTPTTSSNFIDAETPTGVVNGLNPTFTLTAVPNPAASLALHRNGLLQKAGSDYAMLDRTVQFVSAATPQLGDTLLASYRGATPQNLAIGMAASQSSTAFTSAAAAIDGNTDGSFNSGSVTHTNPEANPWWQVDLGSSAIVTSVVIWNRTDCCGERLADYWLFVSDVPFASTDTATTLVGRLGTWNSHQTSIPSPATTILAGVVQGRYVRVQLTGTNILSLAEVQVFGVFP